MTIHTPESETQIYGQGFRPYTGPRRAPSRAVWTLWIYTCGRVLGRRRKFRHKLVPILAALFVWAAAAIFVIINWFSNLLDEYKFVFTEVRWFYQVGVWGIFFLAITIPARILSQDRSGGLFALYMISPITRLRYTSAQSSAVLAVMVLLFLPALLFMFLLYSLLGSGAGSGMDFLNFLWRAPVGSVAIALVPAAIGMAGGCLVKKGGAGSLISVIFFWVPSSVLGILNEVRGIAEEYYLLSPFHLTYGMGRYVFQNEGDSEGVEILGNVSSHWVILANLAWAAAGFAFVWWSSRKWTESR